MQPYYQAADVRLFLGDVRAVLAEMPAESVHACITSPPYWGLRRYLPAGHPDAHFELGGEVTPEEYIANLVEVFRDVRRVLRDDGGLFVNIGDSYFNRSVSREHGNRDTIKSIEGAKMPSWAEYAAQGRTRYTSGHHPYLKEKDRVGVPEMLVLALRADGWYWRCSFPWLKLNCLPEAVRDRFSMANEWVICLSKRANYYWDPEAVRVPNLTASNVRDKSQQAAAMNGGRGTNQPGMREWNNPAGRNRRTTDAWYESLDSVIDEAERWVAHARHVRDNGGLLLDPEGEPIGISLSSEPLREEHYAAFSRKLVRPLIQAATSQMGCCSSCGAGWVRVTEKVRPDLSQFAHRRTSKHEPGMMRSDGDFAAGKLSGQEWNRLSSTTTLGWRPGCSCPAAPPVPAVVMDCFLGSGTSWLVARELGRHFVGCDLSRDYLEIAKRRVEGSLFVPEAVEAPAPVADEPRTLSLFPPEQPEPEPAGLAGEVASG